MGSYGDPKNNDRVFCGQITTDLKGENNNIENWARLP